MLRTVYCFICLVIELLIFIPPMQRMKRLRGKRPNREQAVEVHRYSSGWARLLVKATGARLHVTGVDAVPTDRAVLFVSNHQSDFDIVLFLSVAPCPIGFVAKIEMLKVPLLRTWMKLMRCVFMDRKDMRQSAKVIIEGIDILKDGHSMVVFPEGTRAVSDTPLPFKPGSLKLATKSKACVVPVTVNGSYKVLEGNRYRIKPADVYITFHQPIYTDALNAEEIAALPARVEEIITAPLMA